jgi:hypothetical protein
VVVEWVRVTTTGVGVGVPGRNVIGVGIPLGNGVGNGVGVSVGVGVGVGEGVVVGVGVSVGVEVAVGDGVVVGVELGVTLGVGVSGLSAVCEAAGLDVAGVREEGWLEPTSKAWTATTTRTRIATSVSPSSHRCLPSCIVVGCPFPAPAASDATFYHE